LFLVKPDLARRQGLPLGLRGLRRLLRGQCGLLAALGRAAAGEDPRVLYETVVADTEAEIRRLLAYCHLPFEEQCLRFYENERAVRTPSSEQVRQPIFRAALEHWRTYEPWLGPLKEALGPFLSEYPAVPTAI